MHGGHVTLSEFSFPLHVVILFRICPLSALPKLSRVLRETSKHSKVRYSEPSGLWLIRGHFEFTLHPSRWI